MEECIYKKIQWVSSVPIFGNSVILKQLVIAIGIPFGLAIIFLSLSSRGSRDLIYAIGLVIAAIALTFGFVELVYGGKYEAEFTVDQQGIRCRSEKNQEKKMRIVNLLAILSGFLSKKPAVSGAGMLANIKLNIFIPWDKVKKIKYIDKENIIIVKGNLTENIALFCTEDNYIKVKDYIKGKANV